MDLRRRGLRLLDEVFVCLMRLMHASRWRRIRSSVEGSGKAVSVAMTARLAREPDGTERVYGKSGAEEPSSGTSALPSVLFRSDSDRLVGDRQPAAATGRGFIGDGLLSRTGHPDAMQRVWRCVPRLAR